MAIQQLLLLHPDTNAAFKTYDLISRSTEGNAVFVDNTAGSPTFPDGKSNIILNFNPMSAKRKTDKYAIRVSLPKIVTPLQTGVPTVSSIGRFTTAGGFVFPGDWTPTERELMIHLVNALLHDAQIHDHMLNRKAI